MRASITFALAVVPHSVGDLRSGARRGRPHRGQRVSGRRRLLRHLVQRGRSELRELHRRRGLHVELQQVWIGIEGEVGNAIGVKQTLTFNGTTLARQHSPCFFDYNANAVVNPFGNDRAFVPYATGGLGGLRMLDTEEVANLGVTTPTNSSHWQCRWRREVVRQPTLGCERRLSPDDRH